MRRFLGIFCIAIFTALFVLAVFSSSPTDVPSSGIWDVLGVVSLALYLISSLIVFVEMIVEGNMPTPGHQAHDAALFFWVSTLVILFISLFVINFVTGAPLPFLHSLLLNGIMILWPCIILEDRIYKSRYFKKLQS